MHVMYVPMVGIWLVYLVYDWCTWHIIGVLLVVFSYNM